jgi:membrane protease YdiL (CAAX protease family)
MSKKIGYVVFLFVLGLSGVASLLASNISIPEEARQELELIFTDFQIKLLMLVNPVIMLVGAIVIGGLLSKKVNLGTPIISNFFERSSKTIEINKITFQGILGGILSATLVFTTARVFKLFIPEELNILENSVQLAPITRFLYGGITEEILMRFGLMTLIVFLAQKISDTNQNYTYWVGILLSTLLFALGHLPVVINTVGFSTLLFAYIIIANSFAGLIFGWLYWKKGLESSIIAHIIFHAVILAIAYFSI